MACLSPFHSCLDHTEIPNSAIILRHVELLLEHGAPVDEKNNRGHSATHLAAFHGDDEVSAAGNVNLEFIHTSRSIMEGRSELYDKACVSRFLG
jgi:ankyrin repeat protein